MSESIDTAATATLLATWWETMIRHTVSGKTAAYAADLFWIEVAVTGMRKHLEVRGWESTIALLDGTLDILRCSVLEGLTEQPVPAVTD